MTKNRITDTIDINRNRWVLELTLGARFLSSLWLLLLFASTVTAQLRVYPLPQRNDQRAQKSGKNAASRQQLTPRSLPFWDDFSWTSVDKKGDTTANYPVDSLWVNNYTIQINSGLSLNPPSVNVATFNGLDSAQLPYSDQSTSNGFRDSLVSQPIRLDEVAAAERNSVYLSFFYQWYGNGEPPDPNDYLRVEFKNDQGVWENVMTIQTQPSFTNDKFYDTLLKVDGERFFHDSFQFRFKNYGRLSGPYDTWNLDYIYLNKSRSANDRYLPDRTITSTLTSLFNNYRSIPYDHFLDAIDDPTTAPKFDVFNVNADTSTLSYRTEGTFVHYKDSAVSARNTVQLGGGGTSPIEGTTGVIYQRERKTVTLKYIPDRNEAMQFDQEADSVAVSLKVQLFTGDTFDESGIAYASDYNPAIFKPLDFRSNDTLRADYFLGNYYAYDDGFAEYAVGLTAFGNRAAYQFDMLTDTPDTLAGFDIYYPDYGVTSTLTVDFTVYDDADGLPGTVLYNLPSYPISRIGAGKLKKIRFLDKKFLVEDKFYIGWKAPVGGTFRVGLDTNNDSGSKLFVNTNGTWAASTDVIGAVMIRPVFGGGGDIVTGIEEEKLQSEIFPNPNQGSFFIPHRVNVVQVINVTGQVIPFTTQDVGDNQKISLSVHSSGLYILRLHQDGKFFSAKVLVR
jgi:hypothetical protein